MKNTEDLHPGDIVQIRPDFDAFGFGTCLAIVNEINKSFIQAYCMVPGKGGVAFVNLKYEDFEKTNGRAPWVIGPKEFSVLSV